MKLGIVISGGAAKSIAALGVLKALEEMGIRPAMMSGSSGGGLVSVFCGAGYPPEDQVNMVMKAGAMTYLRPTLSRGGFFSMAGARKAYHHYLGDKDFRDLEFPIYLAATDVDTGEAVYFGDEGEVIPPLVASTSIPALFRPINMDGKMYIDGSVANNLPVEPIVGKCDKIIGIVTSGIGREKRPRSFRAVLGRATEISLYQNAQLRFDRCDHIIQPKGLYKFGSFEISKARYIFASGYETALQNEKEILAALS